MVGIVIRSGGMPRWLPFCLCASTLMMAAPPAAGQQAAEPSEPQPVITDLFRSPLVAMPDYDVSAARWEVPPGWQGGPHVHTGDVFVHVVRGSLNATVEGRDTVFVAGDLYQEVTGRLMLIDTKDTEYGAELLIVQVSPRDAPLGRPAPGRPPEETKKR